MTRQTQQQKNRQPAARAVRRFVVCAAHRPRPTVPLLLPVLSTQYSALSPVVPLLTKRPSPPTHAALHILLPREQSPPCQIRLQQARKFGRDGALDWSATKRRQACLASRPASHLLRLPSTVYRLPSPVYRPERGAGQRKLHGSPIARQPHCPATRPARHGIWSLGRCATLFPPSCLPLST